MTNVEEGPLYEKIGGGAFGAPRGAIKWNRLEGVLCISCALEGLHFGAKRGSVSHRGSVCRQAEGYFRHQDDKSGRPLV